MIYVVELNLLVEHQERHVLRHGVRYDTKNGSHIVLVYQIEIPWMPNVNVHHDV